MMIGASEPWANCQKGSEWFDTKAVNGINNAHYFSIILTYLTHRRRQLSRRRRYRADRGRLSPLVRHGAECFVAPGDYLSLFLFAFLPVGRVRVVSRSWCGHRGGDVSLYVAGLRTGDRKSVQPMAERLAPGDYDQLHHLLRLASGTRRHWRRSCSFKRIGSLVAATPCWSSTIRRCRRRARTRSASLRSTLQR